MRWIGGRAQHPDVTVKSIETVDIHVQEEGNRGRLLQFASDVAGAPEIRCFADADWDRVLGRPQPANVWFTDGRDLEGYVLNAKSVGKVFSLALGRPNVNVEAILQSVERASVSMGALRVLSQRRRLRLPFQNTPLQSFIGVNGDLTVSFRAPDFLTRLGLNAGLGTGDREALGQAWASERIRLADRPPADLMHGKDAFSFLAEIFQEQGLARADAPGILMTAFEAADVNNFPTLAVVKDFLVTGK